MADDPTLCPATTRSRSTRSRRLGHQLQGSTETENKNEDIGGARVTPLHDWPEWLEEFSENFVDEEASASSEAPASISREALHQEPSRNVVSGSLLTSRRTEIAKYAREPPLQVLLAESALVDQYLEQKNLVT